ncbi:MAG: glycosyltransferase family 1 protein [Verrucomicrobiia bacterium]
MKLLVFAHVPPPHHGQSCEVQRLLNGFGDDCRKSRDKSSERNGHGIECYHVNARFSKRPEDLHKFQAGKPFRILFYCLQAIWCRFRYGATNFYYVPASGGRVALYCDWLVMLVCRPFFKKIIFHWHNAGLAKWLETVVQIRTRSLTYRLMKDADLSIVLSDAGRPDAEKLMPLRLATVAGGTANLAQLAQCLRSIESLEFAPWLKPRSGPAAGAPSLQSEFQIARAPAPLKLALTILTENPLRKTGLSTLFHEFVSRSLDLFPDVSWLIFAGPNQEWNVADPRIKLIRNFPANDHLNRRLFADHFQVPAVARNWGADALITVGFVPTRKCLPTVMHVLSLQSLDKRNRLGMLRQFYRNSMIKHNWPQADLVITNSQWTADQVLSLHPEFRHRMAISYEGLQHEIFHPDATLNESHWINEKFGIDPGYFLWISNFYPYKQAGLLIAGYARLDPETRRRHPLVMAGGNWLNGLEAAQAQAKQLGVEQDVKFLGWIDDESLAPLYRQAVAFCLASREETFGRCVIEAMACGTPCVVNDIPIMHEVTNNEALIVDFDNPDAVADAMRKLALGGPESAQLRARGMARAREFTFEKLTTERIMAIQQLVSIRSLPNYEASVRQQ